MLMKKKGNGRRGFLVDCSAVSPILGFVLLLTILMTAMAIIQSTAVPQWNREVEAKHLDSLKYEVADIGRVVAISASTGNPAKIVLNAGVSYPNYYVLFSPSKASTTINAVPLAINVSGNIVLSEQSAAIVVEPNYYYYSRVSLIYEHSAVLREEMNGIVIPESDQSAFSRNSIHLAIIKPNFYSFATTETASIILVPESYGGSQLFSGSIEFECYDEKTARWWNNTLGNIYGSDNVTVVGKRVMVSNLQNITLSVSVFSAYATLGGEVSAAPQQRSVGLVNITQLSLSLYQGSTAILIVKTVDSYGNPVRGVLVSIYDSCSGSSQQTSDENGLVIYYFNAACVGENTVTFSADSSSLASSIRVLSPPSGGSQLRIEWYNESYFLSQNCTWYIKTGGGDTRIFYAKVPASNLLVCFALNMTNVTKDRECELSNSTGWVSVNLTVPKRDLSFKVFAISQNSFATLNITVEGQAGNDSLVCS